MEAQGFSRLNPYHDRDDYWSTTLLSLRNLLLRSDERLPRYARHKINMGIGDNHHLELKKEERDLLEKPHFMYIKIRPPGF